MRPKQFILKASDVHVRARALLLAELESEGYTPPLPAGLVVSLLLLAGVWQCSLSAATAMVKAPPCREAARRAAHGLLPRRPRELLDAVLRMLRCSLPHHLGRTPHPFALDLHQRPFWGKKLARGSRRGQRKSGTSKSFTYATLAALTHHGRFTVGLLPVRAGMRLTTVVGRLLAQAEAAGLCLSYLLADKEFYAAEVVDLLQRAGVAFVVPAERKKATRRLYDRATPPGFYDYGWTGALMRYDPAAKKRRKKGELAVRVRGCVSRHRKTGEPLVYATWGLVGWSPAQVASEYRKRFGIEAGYRQLNQCLARTSSRCERYRLLLVGVALLLCNLWSYLHGEVFRVGPVGEARLRPWLLRLATLCAAVAAHVAGLFGGYVSEWVMQKPIPPEFICET